MGDHHDQDGDGVADRGDYRADLRGQLAEVDWDAARVETSGPDLDAMPSDVAEEDHASDGPLLENGDSLDELTDAGDVDQGVFGDGAYVPAHWWEVS